MAENNLLVRLGNGIPPDVETATDTVGERRVPRPLSGREKAAIVVRLLLNEGADIPLEDLPEELQVKLTQQMGRMGLVDRVTLAAVAHEFSDALEGIGLSFPHGLAGALTAMDGKLAPSTAARLRKEAGVQRMGDPWVRLRALPPAELAQMVEAESTEVAAVVLSKLDTAKAAGMLGKLPGPVARRITFAISRTASVTPEAVERIGWSLVTQLDAKPVSAFPLAPGERVGAILNQSPAATRDGLLDALEEQDAHFAETVRKVIFTFAHIPERLAARDVPAAIRTVENATLVTALAGTQSDGDRAAADYLLANMSNRMAGTLREEMAERGKVKRAEAEGAMAELVTAIRALADEGAISLVEPEDDTEEV
ncbi:flagellar motor switch protein FliG [Lutimaribacter marinistellae]|uniref:Flagellar motor switch protein FliG n=1 Tax=Lutimaribacter marinistellae TaxID=1820329 RepID=A0ABV7TLT9_9RHOB